MDVLKWIKENGLKAAAWLCAACMLCVLPLAFNNAFFDINRFKVKLVYGFGVGFAAVGLVLFVYRMRNRSCALIRFKWDASRCALLIFGVSGVISCGLLGFPAATLTGNEGRYCGLWFLLSCLVTYCVIAAGRLRARRLNDLICATASICALLGIINACGIDPFGFYERMQENQKGLFLSTIGNIDFFGSYMTMLAPLAMSRWITAESVRHSMYPLLCSACMLSGVCASRSDSAFFALQIAFFALLASSSSSWKQTQRVFALWTCSWWILPLMQRLLRSGAAAYDGVLLTLCDTKLALLIGGVFFACALWCYHAERKGYLIPNGKMVRRAVWIVLAVGFALLLALIVLFTCAFPQFKLGSAEELLRFNDEWGTRRGFVWRCSAQAFADYSPLEMLFGRGLDTTRAILTPYFDREDMLAYGVFNDAHNQVLQFLLTGGLVITLSLLVFHVASIRNAAKEAECDGLLMGIRASLAGYTLIALLNVTQPILIATYFSLAALGASHCAYLVQRRETHESGTVA